MYIYSKDFWGGGKPIDTAKAGVKYTDTEARIEYRQTTMPYGTNWVVNRVNVSLDFESLIKQEEAARIAGDEALQEEIDRLNNIVNVTSAYILQDTDFGVNCDGTFAVTLLDATTVRGYVFNINNSGTGQITVSGPQTINGESSIELLPRDSMTIQSTGTNWIII